MTRVAAANRRVFINCPFDKEYQRFFRALIFVVTDCGFQPVCALDKMDGAQQRINKIVGFMGTCNCAIHDISRMKLDPQTKLPRFNMVYELGLFVGAKEFGTKKHGEKECLILDTKPYRYRKSISDVSGQDIEAHDNKISSLIRIVRDWLRSKTGAVQIPGHQKIESRYCLFKKELPKMCKSDYQNYRDISHKDFITYASAWLKKNSLA